jgi:hypothetical protein
LTLLDKQHQSLPIQPDMVDNGGQASERQNFWNTSFTVTDVLLNGEPLCYAALCKQAGVLKTCTLRVVRVTRSE